MIPELVARGAELILRGKGRPVVLYVRRIPGWRQTVEVTDQEPTGRFRFASYLVGRYTVDITLDELRSDLRHAARELAGKQIEMAAA